MWVGQAGGFGGGRGLDCDTDGSRVPELSRSYLFFLLRASIIPVAVGIAIPRSRLYEVDLLRISIPDRELCLAGRCVSLSGDGFALACHVLGHLVLVGIRDQVNRYEGYGGHREYVEGYRERCARRLKQPDHDDGRESSGENRRPLVAQRSS